MAVKQITAKYVYTLADSEPIRNGFVEYDPADGTILRTGICEADCSDEIQDGAIVPGFVNSHCHCCRKP